MVMIDIPTIEQHGVLHSNVAGKFEIVKELPKEANSIDEMFSYADAFGKIRVMYINSAHEIGPEPKSVKHASVIGGEFGFKSANYNGFYTNISSYVSQNIALFNPTKDELNEDFFGKNRDSFSYISHASLNYINSDFEFSLGRFTVEMPYANSDDIRMAPNTFQGALARYNYTDSLHSEFYYLDKWAGYDSQDEEAGAFQDEFKHLVSQESFGMIGASATYEYDNNSELTLWYNYIDDMSIVTYAEVIGVYFFNKEGFHFDYGVQESHFEELQNSGVDGDVLGVLGILHYEDFFVGFAYNKAFSKAGNYISDGFGGGPYYTSLDEATLGAISEATIAYELEKANNVEAFRVGVGYEKEEFFGKDLVMELVYGELKNPYGKIQEADFILTYDFNEKLNAEVKFTRYDSTCDNNTFNRMLLKVDYNF